MSGIKQDAIRYLEDALKATLPDPYDFHSVKIYMDFDQDWSYSAKITFLLPNGFERVYNFDIYGLHKSDMQLLAIHATRKLLKEQLQNPYCELEDGAVN